MIFLSRADILAYFVLNYDSPDLLLCGRKWWLRLKVFYEIIVLSGWLLWRGHFPNRLAEKSISEIKIFTSEVEKITSEIEKTTSDVEKTVFEERAIKRKVSKWRAYFKRWQMEQSAAKYFRSSSVELQKFMGFRLYEIP